MKELPLVPCWFRRLFAAALLALPISASAQALPYLFESDGSGPPNKIYWQTEPGIRYDLWTSDNLADWQHVTGFPATADGLVMEHDFTPGPQGFFSILPLDDQPPVVVSQFPEVDGFAVGRFADLNIELADATGIDPASIRLTVGASGELAPGAAGLTISGNTVTYDSGDTALGAWGETITATLMAADTLGHTLTHTWSFRLEPEPQTAANVFVFGSPTAQRAGQRVSGPAAELATRFPAPAGPVKADDPPPWHIDEVLADRIVIAYEAGGAPAFSAGQLVCNLTPASEGEIFYRRILTTSDDPGNLKLTVMTEDAELTDFALQGSVSFSDDSVVYETAPDGTLVRALSAEITFPRTGYDLSGTSFELKVDGFTTQVPGLPTQQEGTFSGFLSASAPEWYWWFTPRLRVGSRNPLWSVAVLRGHRKRAGLRGIGGPSHGGNFGPVRKNHLRSAGGRRAQDRRLSWSHRGDSCIWNAGVRFLDQSQSESAGRLAIQHRLPSGDVRQPGGFL